MDSMNILPILAVPLGILPLPEAKELNPSLEALFTARARADRRPQRDALCYHSSDDLFDAPEPVVRQLGAAISRGIYGFVGSLNAFADGELAALRLEARGWYSIVQPDGCIGSTNHPLTAWCAVYCVAAPEPAIDRQDSGVVRIHESRLGTMFPDATNSVMVAPFHPGHYGWRPEPGTLAIFPAALTYEVATIRATRALIIVTVRARFVAPGQTGLGRW